MSQTAPFVFSTCHQGAEQALKAEMATQGWRLAFSRPGFVSFKSDHGGSTVSGGSTESGGERTLPRAVFARTASWSLGRAEANDTVALAEQLHSIVSSAAIAPFDALHVWSRDRLPVGERGFETGPEPLTNAIAEDLYRRLAEPTWLAASPVNATVEPGARVLDVVMTDPGKWMIGWHPADSWPPSQWAGGFPPIDISKEVVSRAYFKAAEAILWSRLPIRPGETAVEIGSAPGGAAQRMLELGLHVIGIDPAEMEPEIAEHPHFTHIQARGGDIKRTAYRDAKWLLVDSNVRPDKTLVTVANVVQNQHVQIEGMLLTMKLGRYDQADRIAGWCREIRGWGYTQLEVRQLATGRCEVCIAARKP